MKHHFIVEEAHKDLRLDVYLTHMIENIPSRTFVKKLIDSKTVMVNGKPAKTKYKVLIGDKIDVTIDQASLEPQDLVAEKIALDVFYEDPDIIIINKPIGLTVHPAAGNQSGTLVNALLGRFEELSDINGDVRPGIIHRLDRDTSGLIVVAKTNVAHARLARQFEKHTVIKRYVARVQGIIQYDQGVVDVNIGRHPKYHDQRRVVEKGEGKEAVSLYQVLKRFKKSTLVALFPQTGRTHQLRIHMKHLGHPILGDEKYGRRESFSRLALHAQSIAFEHPITKQSIEFSCPVPAEFLQEN
ncbi:MAG: RluA family pseudouridine synthase [Candidatus Omnitrophica bacterium]|nr:RluA family pseudouridine synthase [Candidatus Omnitrophota bacterium]